MDKSEVLLAILKWARDSGIGVAFRRQGWNIEFGMSHRAAPSNVYVPWVKRHEVVAINISESSKAQIQERIKVKNVTIDEFLSDLWSAEQKIKTLLEQGQTNVSALQVNGLKITPRFVNNEWHFEYEVMPHIGYRLKDDINA